MATRRELLHVNKLEDFRQYARMNGWKEVPTKGAYEVLRLIYPGRIKKKPIIIYRRDSTHANKPLQHLTVYDAGIQLVQAYLKDRKDAQSTLRT